MESELFASGRYDLLYSHTHVHSEFGLMARDLTLCSESLDGVHHVQSSGAGVALDARSV